MLWSEIQEGVQNSCTCRVWSCSSKIHKLINGRMKHLYKSGFCYHASKDSDAPAIWSCIYLGATAIWFKINLKTSQSWRVKHQRTTIYSSTFYAQRAFQSNRKPGIIPGHIVYKWMRWHHSHLSVQPMVVSFQHICMFSSEKKIYWKIKCGKLE